MNRSILKELMEEWRFDSAAATSGAEAIAVMNSAKSQGVEIDCVLMDYQMPDMNGAETYRSMQSNSALADIPVVMLTSVHELEDGKPFSSLGVAGHLMKPVRSSLLQQTITGALLERKSASSDSTTSASEPGIEFARKIGHLDVANTENETGSASDPVEKNNRAHETGNGNYVIQSGLDVLVCEDSEVNQIVFSQILKTSNLNFRIAHDGEEGLELYQKCQPKVILMDVSMPKKDGFEVTREIRSIEADGAHHTPIIGVTAHAIKGDREKCFEAGMDDYMSKPVSPDKLTEKLSRWLNNQTVLAENG